MRNHHLKTKHAISVSEAKTNCFFPGKVLVSFYYLQKHKKSERDEVLQSQDLTVDLEQPIRDYHDQKLREGLTACQNFLVDSDFVRSRQRVLNFASPDSTHSFPKDKL